MINLMVRVCADGKITTEEIFEIQLAIERVLTAGSVICADWSGGGVFAEGVCGIPVNGSEPSRREG